MLYFATAGSFPKLIQFISYFGPDKTGVATKYFSLLPQLFGPVYFQEQGVGLVFATTVNVQKFRTPNSLIKWHKQTV